MDLKGIIFLLLALVFGFLYFKSVMNGDPLAKELEEAKKAVKEEKNKADIFIAKQAKAYEEIIKKIKADGVPKSNDKENGNEKDKGKVGNVLSPISSMDADYYKSINEENRKYHVQLINDLRSRSSAIFEALVVIFDMSYDSNNSRDALFAADLIQLLEPDNEVTKRIVNRAQNLGYRNPFDMLFVKVQKGPFMMGTKLVGENKDNPAYKDEEEHKVQIFQDIMIMDKEVTVFQWNSVLGITSNITSMSMEDKKALMYPKVNVSYTDILNFINALNEKDKEKDYRLPTEEEWEYVCRGGGSGDYDNIGSLEATGWFKKNSKGKVQPVGALLANGFGCYDMTGNVSEWVDGYYGPYNAPETTSGKRMYRGGSFSDSEKNCRAAKRNKADADYRADNLGFRLVIK